MAVEAVQGVSAHTRLGQVRDQVGARRCRNIGVVAARELTVPPSPSVYSSNHVEIRSRVFFLALDPNCR